MNILLVDDEPLVRDSLAVFLEDILGHRVLQCDNAREAIDLFKNNPVPLVLTDIRMPEMDGLEFLRNLKALREAQNTLIVIITGFGDMKSAIQALRAGAYDYLQKPVNVDELAAVVNRIADHLSLRHEYNELTHRFEEKVAEATRETVSKLSSLREAYAEIVGIGRIGVFSDEMRHVVTMAEQLHGDRSVPVLIEGETGTGKEVVARLVHYGKGDETAPFVSINCSAISPTLFESELFGYEGGSFTGSRKEGMKGKLESAQGGTIFLDEIGDLPIELQPKLLRCLQEREMYRVGGFKKIILDVRFICATNRDLARLVEENSFRRDLYYRLNMGRMFIPPLRERKQAIAPLAQMFLEQYAREKKRRFRFISKETVKILENHSWPGNVRELQNAIERVVILYDDIEIRPHHIRFLLSDTEKTPELDSVLLDPDTLCLPADCLDLQSLENTIIKKALAMFEGNKTKAAAYLGMTRSALRGKLRKLL
ncbi:sigma-54 dependent transcriptional regulator [bacterium]|nr:sigma-54 dependent transcriptional regulator [bacterium]